MSLFDSNPMTTSRRWYTIARPEARQIMKAYQQASWPVKQALCETMEMIHGRLPEFCYGEDPLRKGHTQRLSISFFNRVALHPTPNLKGI